MWRDRYSKQCNLHKESRSTASQCSSVTVPEASVGQEMAAISPAAVFFHTTSPVFCSEQISWGSERLNEYYMICLVMDLVDVLACFIGKLLSCIGLWWSHWPGHLFSLHRFCSCFSPGQGSPPKKGPSHTLCLCWTPPPHVLLQLLHELHECQRPSTKENISQRQLWAPV